MSDRERSDLLDTLRHHRHLLRHTAFGLRDDQARTRSTVSELTVGGLIQHVTRMESRWAGFLGRGTEAFGTDPEAAHAAHRASFVMREDQTLEEILAAHAAQAARTDDLVRSVDLDADHALPVTPWWPEGTRWTCRRAIHHVVAETAQHAGHADIIREALDGQKSMG
ncbi:DinB family protein [Sporichthya brevicatena]|uniref:DinB family protein n=1 Tax=Sporichthya brevicatena TaxID=171442 RepID=A0ABP3SDX4_9ACTN